MSQPDFHMPSADDRPFPSLGMEWPTLRQMAGIVALVVFVCASFTAAASAFLLAAQWMLPELPNAVGILGLLARVLAFSLLAGVSAGMVYACRIPISPDAYPARPIKLRPRHMAALLAALLFAACTVLPHLARWPWAAPDETHHLVVAANLAELGVYASGHPDGELKPFDSFDSVGAPVIVPVALLFRVFGVSLVAARAFVGLSFVVLCFVLYRFFRPLVSRSGAISVAVLLPMAFSSIYLGRTLYGEVPAFLYLLVGLLCWRRALRGRWSAWGLAAGICLGLAILSKTILVLSAFCFLGVLLFDFLHLRRIRLPHLVLPGAGVVVAFAAWSLYQSLSHGGDVSGNAGATIGIYQHYLLFGIEPLWKNLRTLAWEYRLVYAVAAAALILMMPILFEKRYDPPAMVLYLLALFYGYWWVFFTPGQLPRYLWFSFAILWAFLGPLFYRALCTALNRRETETRPYAVRRRVLAAVAVGLILWTPFHWTATQVREVYTNQEMQHDVRLAEYVRALPEDARIATSFAPLRNTLNFLARRHVEPCGEALSGPPCLDDFDVVIVRGDGQTPPPHFDGGGTAALGPYAVSARGGLPLPVLPMP